jgi:hypothetical protein
VRLTIRQLIALIGLGLVVSFSAACSAAAPVDSLPMAMTPTVMPQATLMPQPTLPPAIPEARRLVLEWPPALRVGDGELVRLTLEMDEAGGITPTASSADGQIGVTPVEVPNLYHSHNVVVRARLDLAGVAVAPLGEVQEPLGPGQAVTFLWSVRPETAGTYRGVIWVHLDFVPRPEAGPDVQAQTMVLATQRLELNAVNFLGMSGGTARLAGAVGSVVGAVLGLDGVLPWLWRRRPRRLQGGKE